VTAQTRAENDDVTTHAAPLQAGDAAMTTHTASLQVGSTDAEEVASVELTRDEVVSHALALAAAETEEAFVKVFASYVRDVVERETEPYEKIALFVHAMVEGQRRTIAELVRLCNGGARA
jgi:hypothetical protein